MALPLAGAKVLAADFAAIFPVGVDAWTSFTPTLTQGATVAKTTSHAMYMKIGRLVVANYALTVTGAGTASNVVLLGLPISAGVPGFAGVGSAMIFDSSAATFWHGHGIIHSLDTIKFSSYNSSNYLGGAGFTAALASGDIISAYVMYQAAS